MFRLGAQNRSTQANEKLRDWENYSFLLIVSSRTEIIWVGDCLTADSSTHHVAVELLLQLDAERLAGGILVFYGRNLWEPNLAAVDSSTLYPWELHWRLCWQCKQGHQVWINQRKSADVTQMFTVVVGVDQTLRWSAGVCSGSSGACCGVAPTHRSGQTSSGSSATDS